MSRTDDVDEANIPVIAAETVTVKERPQELLVEEGDSVYSLISQEKSKTSSLKTEAEDPVYETSFQQIEEKEGPNRKVRIEEKTEVIDIDIPPVKAAPTFKAQKQAVKKERTGLFFLQIGSLSSDQEAQQESRRLKRKYVPLKTLDIKIVPKELAGKGTYHRLQAGPFESKGEAERTCQDLKQAGAHCLVVS
ncbi:MAG TPA: SPOR domain-containing protein [Bdellovibrionota bacterium]|nr:SPOR domain-containing protein [Bdellovibrionota bacterium]